MFSFTQSVSINCFLKNSFFLSFPSSSLNCHSFLTSPPRNSVTHYDPAFQLTFFPKVQQLLPDVVVNLKARSTPSPTGTLTAPFPSSNTAPFPSSSTAITRPSLPPTLFFNSSNNNNNNNNNDNDSENDNEVDIEDDTRDENNSILHPIIGILEVTQTPQQRVGERVGESRQN